VVQLHLVLPGFEENEEMEAVGKREVRESKSLNAAFKMVQFSTSLPLLIAPSCKIWSKKQFPMELILLF
jgi:hypothetical protein